MIAYKVRHWRKERDFGDDKIKRRTVNFVSFRLFEPPKEGESQSDYTRRRRYEKQKFLQIPAGSIFLLHGDERKYPGSFGYATVTVLDCKPIRNWKGTIGNTERCENVIPTEGQKFTIYLDNYINRNFVEKFCSPIPKTDSQFGHLNTASEYSII